MNKNLKREVAALGVNLMNKNLKREVAALSLLMMIGLGIIIGYISGKHDAYESIKIEQCNGN